jgi:hypothetical protein
MNIPDHIFWVKILKFFDADPGSRTFLTLDPGSGEEKFGSGIRNTDMVVVNVPEAREGKGGVVLASLPRYAS